MRPMRKKLNGMLRNIRFNLEGDADTVFGQQRELKNACLVVITSDQVGAFNTNV